MHRSAATALRDADPRPAHPMLTTAEVAAYLRVKERTIYDMVARQAIPFSRATGKLLFPIRLVDAWLEAQTELPAAGVAPAPPIYAGSNDPLLEWALRQSGSGLAVLARGSVQGLDDLASGRAVLAGLHLLDPESGEPIPGLQGRQGRSGFVGEGALARSEGVHSHRQTGGFSIAD